MQPKLFDIHCHLNFSDFDKDREEVIAHALNAGIWMIIVGTDYENSKRAAEIAEQYKEGVYASVGFHPNNNQKEIFDLEKYKELAKNPKVVVIGECGLDFYRSREARNPKSEIRNKQRNIFKQQIELALEVNKPLMIHCREAHEDLLEIIRRRTSSTRSPSSRLRGNIHFFSGTLEQANKYFDLGFTVSFAGVLTYDVGGTDIVSRLPLDKITIETDAPFVAPVPYRGQRNEPYYVQEVAKKIAEIRGISYEEICQITTQNALKIFLKDGNL